MRCIVPRSTNHGLEGSLPNRVLAPSCGNRTEFLRDDGNAGASADAGEAKWVSRLVEPMRPASANPPHQNISEM